MRRERVRRGFCVVGRGAGVRRGEKEAKERGINKGQFRGRTKGHFSVLKVSLIGCLCLNFSENGGNKISSQSPSLDLPLSDLARCDGWV